ncbi:MAG: alternative ribosome rescue aminoacyl-tRNA hydrolase ArfB [Patescibacteria group bacterium]
MESGFRFESEDPTETETDFTVLDDEVEFTFARSGGPGGQNVNRRATKVHLRWDFERSPTLNDKQKGLIREGLKGFINKDGVVALEAQEERSQGRNRQIALDKLNALVAEAFVPEKERIATKTPRSSRERRLEGKRATAQKKKGRRFKNEG